MLKLFPNAKFLPERGILFYKLEWNKKIISEKGEEGGSRFLIYSDKGGGEIGQFKILADKGGMGGLQTPIFDWHNMFSPTGVL